MLEVSIAFAGFSIGEAEGLRRAMSRKRSDAAIEAYHERFVAGAQRMHGVDGETAERVFEMVKGFSGFGFPKAHGAAFGLLAYQSTWLRVHYAPEFLCALLNEQPMGFYPPDALVHEAQRRGIEVLAPDVNESGVECDVVLEPSPRVRIGLGYVRGARREELEQLVDARERAGGSEPVGPGVTGGSGADALSLLAWSGACDALALAGAVSARRCARMPRPRARGLRARAVAASCWRWSGERAIRSCRCRDRVERAPRRASRAGVGAADRAVAAGGDDAGAARARRHAAGAPARPAGAAVAAASCRSGSGCSPTTTRSG